MTDLPLLSPDELARYEWQMWTPGLGEEGQRKLKGASVVVSRIGGVGGTVAYYLAAAGIGRLILAHRGKIKPSDLNRQLLMTTDGLGTLRTESAKRRLNELNPHVDVVTLGENVQESNAARLVEQADIVVGAAPLFEERFLLNREAVRQGKPLVDAAMYDMDARLTTILPGQSACLSCLYPETPPHWRREFPVLGAVSGTVAAMAAVEAIKLITGIGTTLAGHVLAMDLRTMEFRKIPTRRRPDCPTCS